VEAMEIGMLYAHQHFCAVNRLITIKAACVINFHSILLSPPKIFVCALLWNYFCAHFVRFSRIAQSPELLYEKQQKGLCIQ
jgi:hypothetical protein